MTLPDNASFYQSHDGLNLYYRDFQSTKSGTPIICLPGLTRNSRDFDELAARFCTERRIITTDLRGRGFSDYDPEMSNYQPETYVRDVWTLLDTLEIENVIVIGTSLGGLCAMVMAAQQPGRVRAVVLNDIGPEINPAGVERIKEYAGKLPPVSNWEEAIEQTRVMYSDSLPGLSEADLEKLARRGFREINGPVPEPDVDSRVGDALRAQEGQTADLWPLYDALKTVPTTLIWGVLSDILTADIVASMKAAKADLNVVEVDNRGHVPLLDEPHCLQGIRKLLETVP